MITMEHTLRAALIQYSEEQLAFIKANLSSRSVSIRWAARGLAQATFLRHPYLRETQTSEPANVYARREQRSA